MMIEPLVLLPGMMCDARLFEHQFLALSRQRAVTVAPITEGARIEDITSGLLEQMPQRFALAGLSMGGIVAMEMARRAPGRITRLCLIDTNPLAETPEQAAEREPLIVLARTGRLDEAISRWMAPEYLAPGPGRAAVLARVMEMAMELGPEVFERQCRAQQRRRDQQVTLRKCPLETLILCGEHDRLTPVRRHEFMAELMPAATFRIIEGAGHLPTLERPEFVTDVLRDWLRDAPPEG